MLCYNMYGDKHKRSQHVSHPLFKQENIHLLGTFITVDTITGGWLHVMLDGLFGEIQGKVPVVYPTHSTLIFN